MTAALLDVNVPIALIDTEHLHYHVAIDWFAAHATAGRVSCPLTQNGAAPILAGSSCPGLPGPAAATAGPVATMGARPHHRFWPDAISRFDAVHVDLAKLPGGWLALDRRLRTAAVPDGERHLELVAA